MSIKSKFSVRNFRKAILYCKKNGLSKTVFSVIERLQPCQNDRYVPDIISDLELRAQKEYQWEKNYKVSILVPAYETKEIYLRQMVESVLNQTYQNFELIIADASTTNVVENVITEIKEKILKENHDMRIVYRKIAGNGGISENTNKALEIATGKYIGLLDHDDVLAPNALFEMVYAIEAKRNQGHNVILAYSDEDKVDELYKTFFEPHYKLDFNLDLLLSNNYICHFCLIRADYIRQLGFRKEFDGAQDYDLFLRVISGMIEEKGIKELKNRVVHVDKILYHWRCHSGSTAENPGSKMYAYEAGKKAVESFLFRLGWDATVSHTNHLGFYRVSYQGDIFQIRKDIGIIGGNVIKNQKIVSGAGREDGTVLYKGLSKNFSGYMHRAVLQQEVDTLDAGNYKVREELCSYVSELQGTISNQELCKRVRELGYSLLFDPFYR